MVWPFFGTLCCHARIALKIWPNDLWWFLHEGPILFWVIPMSEGWDNRKKVQKKPYPKLDRIVKTFLSYIGGPRSPCTIPFLNKKCLRCPRRDLRTLTCRVVWGNFFWWGPDGRSTLHVSGNCCWLTPFYFARWSGVCFFDQVTKFSIKGLNSGNSDSILISIPLLFLINVNDEIFNDHYRRLFCLSTFISAIHFLIITDRPMGLHANVFRIFDLS